MQLNREGCDRKSDTSSGAQGPTKVTAGREAPSPAEHEPNSVSLSMTRRLLSPSRGWPFISSVPTDGSPEARCAAQINHPSLCLPGLLLQFAFGFGPHTGQSVSPPSLPATLSANNSLFWEQHVTHLTQIEIFRLLNKDIFSYFVGSLCCCHKGAH